MNVAFRVDSGLAIGNGHFMRCLALARELHIRGVGSIFLCRCVIESLAKQVRDAGFEIIGLAGQADSDRALSGVLPDVTQEEDAEEFLRAIRRGETIAVVVDHYSLGASWETRVSQVGLPILAVDDVGRAHQCDYVLDQNYHNPAHKRYFECLPETVHSRALLLGPEYALLRPEFARLRPDALLRRHGQPRSWLLFMSGTDPTDETSKALEGIIKAYQPSWHVDVVVGSCHPGLANIAEMCDLQPGICLHEDTPHMAEIMAQADCAVGSGGSATWERCALGLPAIVTTLADNQVDIAQAVTCAGAQHLLPDHKCTSSEVYAQAISEFGRADLTDMAAAAAAICDGLGASRVADFVVERVLDA